MKHVDNSLSAFLKTRRPYTGSKFAPAPESKNAGRGRGEAALIHVVRSLDPRAVANALVDLPDGRRVEVDAWSPAARTAFEFDGGGYHSGADHLDDALLLAAMPKGSRVVHVGDGDGGSCGAAAQGDVMRVWFPRVPDRAARDAYLSCALACAMQVFGVPVVVDLARDDDAVRDLMRPDGEAKAAKRKAAAKKKAAKKAAPPAPAAKGEADPERLVWCEHQFAWRAGQMSQMLARCRAAEPAVGAQLRAVLADAEKCRAHSDPAALRDAAGQLRALVDRLPADLPDRAAAEALAADARLLAGGAGPASFKPCKVSAARIAEAAARYAARAGRR